MSHETLQTIPETSGMDNHRSEEKLVQDNVPDQMSENFTEIWIHPQITENVQDGNSIRRHEQNSTN